MSENNFKLTPAEAVIHNAGATFAYEPIAGAHTATYIGVVGLRDGSKRYYHHQSTGPFGNSNPLAEDVREGFDDVKTEILKTAYEIIAQLDAGIPFKKHLKVSDIRTK